MNLFKIETRKLEHSTIFGVKRKIGQNWAFNRFFHSENDAMVYIATKTIAKINSIK